MAQGFDKTLPKTLDALESQPVRINLNALFTSNSGPSSPSDPETGTLWVDTSDSSNLKLNMFLVNTWVTILNNLAGGAPSQSTVERFLHTQASSSTSWSILHNLDTTEVVAFFYNGAGQQIFPNQMTIVDEDNITATFAPTQSGTALIVG